MRRRGRAFIPVLAVLGVLGAACGHTGEPATSGAAGSSSTSRSTSTSADAPPSCAATGTETHRDLRYAATSGVAAGLQSLDLYLPARPNGCPPVPVVVYVHGGAFRVGDKGNNIADKVTLFTTAGWGFASLNYRLVGHPGSGSTNGMYPAAEQDVAAGVGLLADRASEYGLDPQRIMLLGHSAGAHLVALVSTDGSFLQAAGVPLADVVCTAPLDTSFDIPTQVAGGGVNAAMYATAFSDDPAVQVKGSPNRNVAPGTSIPSFHIVTRGLPKRVTEAQSFGETLRDAGVSADVQVATGLSHEEVNDRVGRADDTVITPALMSFFRTCAQHP